MIIQLKILLAIIYSSTFIFCINRPFYNNSKWDNPKIVPDIIINSNQEKNSFLNFGHSECSLAFLEKYKYIFSENGIEFIEKSKYINKGDKENCITKKSLNHTYTITDIKIEGGDNLNYTVNSDDTIEFYFNLQSKKKAIITYKAFYKENLSKFYYQFRTYIGRYTKYIFRARQPLEIIGTKNGWLNEAKQKNGAIYCYSNGNNKNGFYETLYLSAYGIKFKSELSISLDFTIGRILKYIKVPNLHEFGNNEIITNKVLSNLKENEYTVENDKRFITIKSNKRYRKFHFTFLKEFQSKLDNEWIMKGADLVNTCTIKTKNKVIEILSNSNSKEKDYIILGRWVYNNIEYKEVCSGAEMTVDEILEKKVGVCHHKTLLYNSFLNCIGIDAMYTNGFAHTKNNNNIDLETRHAWTVAKIDGKWIPLDSTWNIFNGKLHLGHIFRYYGEKYRSTSGDWGIFGFTSSTNEEKSESIPVNLKITALNFFSRELDDDDEGDFDILEDDDEGEGDFEITFNNYYIYIIIILLVVIFYILVICFIRRKRRNKNEGLLNKDCELNDLND